MSRKWWLLLAAMFACVVAVCVTLYPAPSETKVAFDRVKMGMHDTEVQALFGEPGFHFQSITSHVELWFDKNGHEAYVTLTNNVATNKTWHKSSASLTARLRRWLPFMKE